MFRSLFTRRRGVAVAAATIGAARLSLAFAGSAGATAYPDNSGNASLIVGSGSQTSYATMTSLADLFNGSPGCDLTASTSLPQSLGCGTTSVTAGSTGGEQGFPVAADNPYNDFAVNAPAIGSGAGATALQNSGAGAATQRVDFARYSSHKGNTTVNDVEYATDGVSWTTFNEVNGVATNQAKVANITKANLVSIYNGTLGCSITKGKVTTNYTMDWICLGAKASSPIDVYVAQTGSGTYSTWQGALLFSTSGPGGIVNPGMEQGWVANGGSGGTLVSAHENLFENEMSTISAQPDAKDAIYFMSLGKFTTTCVGKNGKKVVCAGMKFANTFTTFGQIDGVTADQHTVQGTGGGAGVTFPITRGLYNSYANSSAADPSSQASLNFIGEDGFLCKSSTVAELDPQTGVSYRTEIENAIDANGFFPLDVNTNTPFAEGAGTLANPGTVTDAAYAANDNGPGNTGASSGAGAGSGFCLVTVG
jgi:hypothetical protein